MTKGAKMRGPPQKARGRPVWRPTDRSCTGANRSCASTNEPTLARKAVVFTSVPALRGHRSNRAGNGVSR